MHIGLTGTNAAGKTTILKYLKGKGYPAYSLSDILRQELQAQKLAFSRTNLIEIGNKLRKEYGPGVLAKRIIQHFHSKPDLTEYSIIDSIRNPAEISALRTLNNFILIGIDAPLELRFERAQRRNRQENVTSLEAFQKMGELENSQEPDSQNISACLQNADYKIINDGSETALKQQVDEIITNAQLKIRPGWDEYFLKMAFLVAERSTCLRRHVGAIIVDERQVLSTGYNGAARHTRDCLELGCLRDELKIPSGERHEICRGIHAEQNAIVQAARHGVNINHGTIYCTHSPCTICAKIIVNAGIERVVVNGNYPDLLNMAHDLFQEVGVRYQQIPTPIMSIKVKK